MTRSGRHGGFAGGFGYVGGRRQVALIRPTADPILAQLCAALDATYGGSIERVVLFGSPARCESMPIRITTWPRSCAPRPTSDVKCIDWPR